jgi:deoxyadenosine/deoxycytidine kinase
MIVALEGLPGSGKSTTAELLGQTSRLAYAHERSSDHPFLDAFYSNIERYKFETELCFLLLHYHQYRDLDPALDVVLDYSPVKDLVFADLNLEGDDYELFSQTYARTSGSLPAPEVVIFLQLDIDLVLQRIAARGRPYERGIDPGYLAQLASAYERRLFELGERVERVLVTPEMARDKVAAAALAAIRR